MEYRNKLNLNEQIKYKLITGFNSSNWPTFLYPDKTEPQNSLGIFCYDFKNFSFLHSEIDSLF